MVRVKGLIWGTVLALLLWSPHPSFADEDLVLQLVINDAEMQDFVEGIDANGHTYLPLAQLSNLLDFPITVDAKAKTAKGWFVRVGNTIKVDEKEAVVKGETYKLGPAALIVRDEDIFIDAALLQKWFPIDFSVDKQHMVLDISTRENLPFQEALFRKQMHDRLAQQQRPASKTSSREVRTAYTALGWPSADIVVSPSYDSKTNAHRLDYSATATDEIGYLTTHVYAAGNLNEKELSDLRLSAGRSDYAHGLLGSAQATFFEFGDISSASLPQTVSQGIGRGAVVTNRDLSRADQFDTTNFTGDSRPGWDVELYRNDVLLSFQTVAANGRYEFLNVPILFGNNEFKLKFYGPQGERDELTKTINASAAILDKGAFTYNLSVDQKGRTIFGLSDSTSSFMKSNSPRLVGEVEYGLTKFLTVTAGAARTQLQDGDHDYATAGLHGMFGPVLAALDHAFDMGTSSRSTRLSLSTTYKETNIQLQQKAARDFTSEEETDPSNPVKLQTDLSLDRTFDVPVLGFSSHGLQLTRKVYETRIERLLTYRLTKTFFGLSFNNSISLDRDNIGLNQIDGDSSLRMTVGPAQLSLSSEYDVRPVAQVNSVKFNALFPLAQKVSNNFTTTRYITSDRRYEFENAVTFDMDKYRLSLTGRYDTNSDWYIGMTYNVSIGRVPGTKDWIVSSRPLADTGIVAVYPYLDANGNQMRDANEQAYPQAVMRIGTQTPKPSDGGYTVATQLPVDAPVTVKLDPERQENPYLAAAGGSYNVVPRPGRVISVDFPVVEASEVDGYVKAPDGVAVANLGIELLNNEGLVIAATHTAYDGYYLLEGVMPGSYTLRVKPEGLLEKGLKLEEERALSIAASEFYTRDLTIVSVK